MPTAMQARRENGGSEYRSGGTPPRIPRDRALSLRQYRVGQLRLTAHQSYEIRQRWCEPANALHGAVIPHLHGGWSNLVSAAAYRHLVGHIARRARTIAFVPDHRLAPERPFRAAIEYAQATLHEGDAPCLHRGVGQLEAAGSAFSCVGEFLFSRLAPDP